MAQPAGDLVAAPLIKAPAPKSFQYDHGYVPVSPPFKRSISWNDPVEVFDGWEGWVADKLDDMTQEEGRRFQGATCKSVCQACIGFAAQGNNCACYATCKTGSCGSNKPHVGWSDDTVSAPRELWEASCKSGPKECASQCADKTFLKEVKDCKKDTGNPIECFRKLRKKYRPVPFDARRQVVYCMRKGMKTCDAFQNVPTDTGWKCFEWDGPCKEDIARNIGGRIPWKIGNAPNVWNNAGIIMKAGWNDGKKIEE
jgi:hypothetical protein